MMMKLMMEAVMDVAIWGVTYSLNGSSPLVFFSSFRSLTEKMMNIARRYTITPTTDAMINRTYNKSIRQTDRWCFQSLKSTWNDIHKFLHAWWEERKWSQNMYLGLYGILFFPKFHFIFSPKFHFLCFNYSVHHFD